MMRVVRFWHTLPRQGVDALEGHPGIVLGHVEWGFHHPGLVEGILAMAGGLEVDDL